MLDSLVRAHGPEVSFSRFGKLTLLVSSIALVDEILVGQADAFLKGEEERALAAVVGWGLLVQEGSEHRRVQKALNPGMRGAILEAYLLKIQSMLPEILEPLRLVERGLVDFCREASQSLSETSLFGLSAPTRNFAYHRAVHLTNKFAMSDVSPGRDTHDDFAKFLSAKNAIHTHVDQLMTEWKAQGVSVPSLMDYIVALVDPTDDWQTKSFDQAGMFLQAATETTASLLAWLFLHLSSKGELWDRLIEEAEAFGARPVSHQELTSLTFHQAVIKETLRIAPPVWMIPRVARQDIQIGKMAIPRGTRVVLSPWVTQRSSASFASPKDFDPDRWLSDHQRPPGAHFFPFGRGSRVCIGEAYGRMTATAMLFHLTSKQMRVSVTPEDTETDVSHLLRIPRPDLFLSLK